MYIHIYNIIYILYIYYMVGDWNDIRYTDSYDLPISLYFVTPIGDIPALSRRRDRKSHPNCTYCEAGAKLRSNVLVCRKCDLAMGAKWYGWGEPWATWWVHLEEGLLFTETKDVALKGLWWCFVGESLNVCWLHATSWSLLGKPH